MTSIPPTINALVQMPPALEKGDCIGLFSPSGPVREREKYEAGLQVLHDLGYHTRQYPVEPAGHPYLAADDEWRASELRAMWKDPEVKAMMAVRGGYGCLRMMPYLDMNMLADTPKMIIGFSDLTVLLNTIVDRVHTIGVHGPVLTSLAGSDGESVRSLRNLLEGNFTGVRHFPNLEILRGGKAAGILRGGNLTTIAHLLGTPWEIPCKDTILIIEDTGEPAYKIDRILTQLYVSGRLEKLAGLLVGTFDCGEDERFNLKLRDDIWQRVLELTAQFAFPVWGNFPVGHLRVNHAFPLGLTVVMESASGSLHIMTNKNAKKAS